MVELTFYSFCSLAKQLIFALLTVFKVRLKSRLKQTNIFVIQVKLKKYPSRATLQHILCQVADMKTVTDHTTKEKILSYSVTSSGSHEKEE